MESYYVIRYEQKLLPISIENLILNFLFPQDNFKDDKIRNREIELFRQYKDQSVLFTIIKNDVIAVVRCIFKNSENEKLPIEYSTVVNVLDNDSLLNVGDCFKTSCIPCAEVGSLKVIGDSLSKYRILLALINSCEHEINKIKNCNTAFITCLDDPLLNSLYIGKCQFFNKAIVTYDGKKNWLAMCRTSVTTTVRPNINLEKIKIYTHNTVTV